MEREETVEVGTEVEEDKDKETNAFLRKRKRSSYGWEFKFFRAINGVLTLFKSHLYLSCFFSLQWNLYLSFFSLTSCFVQL